MNLTVGGLLGYSSVNSNCNLNVPVGTDTKVIRLINTASYQRNEILRPEHYNELKRRSVNLPSSNGVS